MKQERVEEIYEALVGLTVELDSNPAALGPTYMQSLISTTRGYLNKVAYFMQEVLREKHGLEDELAAHEAAFEITSNELMAHDARVTRLPAVDDRKAMINVILSEDRKKILELGVIIKNLGAVEKVIRHRQRELDRTMSEIRLQRSIIATEVRTGSFYGSEDPSSDGTFGNQPPRDDIGEDEIEALMREADASLAEETVEEETAEEETAESETAESEDEPEQTDVEALLAGLEDDESPEDSKPTDEPEPAKQEATAEADPEDPDVDPDIARFLDGEEDLGDIFEQL